MQRHSRDMSRLMTHLARSLALTLIISQSTACSAAERPVAELELVAPLSEISGLALLTTTRGSELLAVGDEAYAFVSIPLVAGTPDPTRARLIELPLPHTSGGSELEGIAVDADGHVLVLIERGEVWAFDYDGEVATTRWHKPITFSPGHPLANAWNADSNKRGEGIALVGKRMFILKQSGPAALIELLDTPDALVASLAHELVDMSDASDLAVVGDELRVIGASAAKICAFAIPGEKGPGGPIKCAHSWPTPATLGKGKLQWEGLAFLPDGRVVVAVDRKKIGRTNLALLPPLAR